MELPLDMLIEGLLFYKASPQKKSTLMKLFAVSEEDFAAALVQLSARLDSGATRLLETDSEIELVTAPDLAEFIDALRRDELSGDIGKAGAETLAIILYRGPISRPEIDRIRGVNSTFILRNLLTRGLINREATGKTNHFSASPALLEQLGITHKHTLPDFAAINDRLDTFAAEQA